MSAPTRPRSSTAARALLDQVAEGGARTVEHGVVERSFLIAARRVRFLFGGEQIATALTKAFAHLPRCDGQAPDLTVVAWDTASNGVPPPALPPDVDPSGPMWRRVLIDDPPVHAVYKPGPGALSIIDRSSNRAWYWCAEAAAIPPWEQGTPFLHVLHHWLSSTGVQLVHAGAAGAPDGGALFIGRSGSGKSTSTLACVRGGMAYAGDDYVGIEPGAIPVVHALYSSGKLDDGTVHRFPEVASRIANPEGSTEEKRVFYLHDVSPELVADQFPLRSVLLPKVTPGVHTRVAPTSAAAALAALAPSTIFQMPGAASKELAGIAAVLRGVPAHVLEAGSDLSELADVVRALVDGGAPRSGR